jgi:two-component SAPR family response regulator
MPHKYSEALMREIRYKQDIVTESGESVSEDDVIIELIKDMDERDSVAYELRNELKRIGVELGYFKEMSKQEMDNVYVSSGKKYDFKLNGKYYGFADWKKTNGGIK